MNFTLKFIAVFKTLTTIYNNLKVVNFRFLYVPCNIGWKLKKYKKKTVFEKLRFAVYANNNIIFNITNRITLANFSKITFKCFVFI